MQKLDLTQFNQNTIKMMEEKNYRAAIEDASGMIAIASMQDDYNFFLLGKYYLGLCYYHLHDYQSSMAKFMELTNFVLNSVIDFEQLGLDQVFFDKVRYNMAVDMFYLGDLDGSSIILQQILKNSDNMDIILDGVILLGSIYLKMYELSEDLNYLLLTLEMYLTFHEKVSISRSKAMMIYNNLAMLFTYQGDYEKAQEMLNYSFLKASSPNELFAIFNKMAWIYLKMKNIKKVSKNLEKAVEYLDQTILPQEEGFHYLLWGILLKEEEQYPEAQRLMGKSLFYAKNFNDHLEQIRVYKELSFLYQEMELDHNSEYMVKHKELKNKVNLVKKVINWSEVWQEIKVKNN
ncbi:MAG: hypothetical protein KAX49_08975 [Halanaerobiales bacterium]|nr:hypothetical protein [Halanaerobiales bacterium]